MIGKRKTRLLSILIVLTLMFTMIMPAAVWADVTGTVAFDAATYDLDDTVTITVADADLNVDPLTAETVTVDVTSTTDAVGTTVQLTETGADTGVFEAGITVSAAASAADTNLEAAAGDTITVSYADAADASGNPATPTDTATINAATVSATLVSPQQYDLNAPADVTATVTLIDATDVTGVSNGVAPLTVDDDYSFAAGTLTIKDSYLSTLGLAEGDAVTLTVTFDAGDPVTLVIDVINSVVVSATLVSPQQYDLNAPADVTATVTLIDATDVTGVSNGVAPLTVDDDYSFAAGTLTIKDTYLSTLGLVEGNTVTLTVTFDAGDPVTLVIDVIGTIPGSVADITTNNVLLVGRHAFDLNDPSYTLNNYLTAVDNFVYQSGGNYEIYYRAAGQWYNLVAAEGQGLVPAAEVDPGDINGDGFYHFMNMVDVTTL
jgi:formylmethanofuran dehydrogenase subunit D